MILIHAFVIMVVSHSCAGQLATEKEAVTVPEKEETIPEAVSTVPEEDNPFDSGNENTKEFYMKRDIEEIANLAHDAETMLKSGTPLEDVERVYDEMINILDEIKEALKDPTNVDKFVEAQGFFRIFSINLYNNDTALRTKLLTLFKDLLDKIPEKTKAELPLNIIDRVLSIFESDDNLAIKAHAVDVLNKLLPKNPTAQLRVMKIKGLEVFYKQINILDISVIDTLMELFNKIVKEHIEVRRDPDLKDNADEKLMYQRMGLMELLSTPHICNGMLDVFSMLWAHNSNDHGNIRTFLELLKNMNQFCSKIYKRKPKAISFFENLINNVKEGDRMKYFDDNNIKFDEFLNAVEDYVVKDEDGQKDAFQKELHEVNKDDATKDEF